jgi:hypothetical protein
LHPDFKRLLLIALMNWWPPGVKKRRLKNLVSKMLAKKEVLPKVINIKGAF